VSAPSAAQWRLATPKGTVRVATHAELETEPIWAGCFAHSRKDSRYYDLVDETLRDGFEHHYFVLEDEAATVRAIQPFFLLDQDVLAGSSPRIRALAAGVRQYLPRFLTLRTLMVGCAAGEGHLPFRSHPEAHWTADRLEAALMSYARLAKAGLVVLKDFPADYRSALARLTKRGYVRLPSMPATRLNIAYGDFEEYCSSVLSRATRKDLRRKFRRAAMAEAITLEVTSDATSYVDELYPLYLQVYERSTLRFEKLTKEFLAGIGRTMPDKVRFLIWRQGQKAVAFSLCMLQDDELWDEYIGLDYAVAFDLHLYFVTFRDTVRWAMSQGYRWYCSSALSYEPKARLRSELIPLDLYVSHTSALARLVLRFALPWLEPTRNDAALRKFPNFGDLKR
jgi:hypothetical protein